MEHWEGLQSGERVEDCWIETVLVRQLLVDAEQWGNAGGRGLIEKFKA